MIDKKKILGLIKLVLLELENIIDEYKSYSEGDEAIQDVKKVLDLLVNELNSKKINERVLRAMHDIGMSSYKDFENTKVEYQLNELTKELYDVIPEYKYLQPLRSDFGKGIPI